MLGEGVDAVQVDDLGIFRLADVSAVL
jgi:hypothetical protein